MHSKKRNSKGTCPNCQHAFHSEKHLGFYPVPKAAAHFAYKLDEGGYPYSKGSIRIPWSGAMPLALIAELAAWYRDTGKRAGARREERHAK